MSIQKQLLEDILSNYNIIDENRRMVFESSTTLRSTLSSLGYTEKNGQLTSGGEVNDKLTDIVSQILTSYKKVAPSVAVTITAGNDKFHHGLNYKSQHTLGNAIDVVISPYNTQNANEFINILNSTKNSDPQFSYIDEYKNPSKASTGGHFHLQYGTDNTSQTSTGTTQTNTGTTQTNTSDASTSSLNLKSSGGAAEFAKSIGGQILNVMGIKESAEIRKFGSNVQSRSGRIIIPKNDNTKIKAPLSGKITNILSNKSCINQVVIEVSSREFTGYLEYCGITEPSVQIGDKVNVGDLLGTTKSNVTVTFYTENKKVKPISDTEPKKNATGLSSLFLTKPSGNNPNKKTDSTKTEKRSSGNDRDKKPEKPINAKDEYSKMLIQTYRKFKNPFKLEENINRIKGLL